MTTKRRGGRSWWELTILSNLIYAELIYCQVRTKNGRTLWSLNPNPTGLWNQKIKNTVSAIRCGPRVRIACLTSDTDYLELNLAKIYTKTHKNTEYPSTAIKRPNRNIIEKKCSESKNSELQKRPLIDWTKTSSMIDFPRFVYKTKIWK